MCECKHKHYETIIAWAEGRKIQYKRSCTGLWNDTSMTPSWDLNTEYRIKPEPKPDAVRYTRCDEDVGACYNWTSHKANYHNIKATFDGETNKLKSVEMI